MDEQEWLWSKRGDDVLHIELRKWADMMLIAPLSANTLAKMASGICDNTLSLVVRCWDFSGRSDNKGLNKPLLVCPAMNTMMLEHPITRKQLTFLTEELGVRVIDPVIKTLICGESGSGAMAPIATIVSCLLEASDQTH